MAALTQDTQDGHGQPSDHGVGKIAQEFDDFPRKNQPFDRHI